MTHMKKPALLAAILAATAFASLGSAQAQQAAPGDRHGRRKRQSDLAKKLQNPIGDLYSFPFQGNTNFGVGPHNGAQEILNVQPVIPIHVNEDWNVITRTILPLVWNPDMSPLPSSAFGTAPRPFRPSCRRATRPMAGSGASARSCKSRPPPRPTRLQRLGRRRRPASSSI